jgi:hypothetical protein
MSSAKPKVARTSLAKAPTGSQGLDEVTAGGLRAESRYLNNK